MSAIGFLLAHPSWGAGNKYNPIPEVIAQRTALLGILEILSLFCIPTYVFGCPLIGARARCHVSFGHVVKQCWNLPMEEISDGLPSSRILHFWTFRFSQKSNHLDAI